MDCVFVVGANSTIRDSTNTTIPRIRLVMAGLLRLIRTEQGKILGGVLWKRVEFTTVGKYDTKNRGIIRDAPVAL